VLTAGTGGAMTWAANSASNYYLDGITKTNNTLTFSVNGATNNPTYGFGDGAFADFAGSNANTFGTAGTVARSDHNHSISNLTGAGGLASKDSVSTAEIVNKAVTAAKLSPTTAGTNGQVLALNSSLDLVWVNSSGTVIADARLLPSSMGDTNSDEDHIGGQILRVNSAGTLTEYTDLLVQRDEIDANGTPASGKVLGLNSNNDLEWIAQPSPTIGPDAVLPSNISIIADNSVATTAGHLLVSNGAEFSNVAMSGDIYSVSSAGAVKLNLDNLPSILGGTKGSNEIAIVDKNGLYVNASNSGVMTISDLASAYAASSYNSGLESFTYNTDYTGIRLKDNGVTHAKLENRYTAEGSLTTNAAITVNCSTAVNFKLTADLSAATTFTLTNYKVGHCITIWNIKGNQTVNLTAGTGTPVFNKVGGVDYEDNGTDYNVMQIECIDDDAANPVFFYSLQTYASDKDDINGV